MNTALFDIASVLSTDTNLLDSHFIWEMEYVVNVWSISGLVFFYLERLNFTDIEQQLLVTNAYLSNSVATEIRLPLPNPETRANYL